MDVIFVASWYPSKLHATNGNFIEQHARAVTKAGGNVRVVHMAYSNRILMPQIEMKIQNEIRVYHMLIPRVLENSMTAKGILFKKLVSRFDASDFHPKIVHGHVVYPAGELALFLSKHFQVPLVFTEHWSGYKSINADRFTKNIKRLTEEVLQNTDLIMPVSHDLGESMKAKGFRGNYAVVNNTVNTKIFYPSDRQRNEKFQFLHISNFEPRAKNTEGIIRAFVRGNFKNATLTIAGDGDLEKLKGYAKSLDGDSSQIIFHGALEYSEVADLMRSSDCFVLFSNFENLPCVIAEAHCCGLPVLATNVGGIPEMIDDTNGKMIAAGDEEQLISTMHYFIENGSNFNNFEIADTAANRYSYSAIGEQFLKYYKRMGTHG